MLNNIIKTITANPRLYDFCQFVFEGEYQKEVARIADAGSDEKILDLGCGTGYFSKFFNCDYTGVDCDRKYLDFAKKIATEKRKFCLMDARKINFPDKSFDKVVIINCLHHLSDEDARQALQEAKRLAKKNVYVFDMDTEALSFITPLLLRLDNGKFIRSIKEQIELIEPILKIKNSLTFKTPRKIFVHSAIICEA